MSKIKNGGLDQYCAEPFKQQKLGTSGIAGVNIDKIKIMKTNRTSCNIIIDNSFLERVTSFHTLAHSSQITLSVQRMFEDDWYKVLVSEQNSKRSGRIMAYIFLQRLDSWKHFMASGYVQLWELDFKETWQKKDQFFWNEVFQTGSKSITDRQQDYWVGTRDSWGDKKFTCICQRKETDRLWAYIKDIHTCIV